MRTYVLACNELPERRDAAIAHLRARGVRATVWPSVHGKTWALETRAEYEPGKRISPGHVGLLLGHWTLWGHLNAECAGDDPFADTDVEEREFLVLEDDAVLPEGWFERYHELRRELFERFPDWQFVFVGLAETEPHVWNKVSERIGGPDSRLCRLSDPFGTHAYLVRESALPVLLERFPAGGAARNMDQQLYQNVLRDGHLRWCAVLPTLVRQRTFDYAGTGVPEWAPSCVDAPDAAPRVNAAASETAEQVDRTMAHVDPFPCFYRGEALDTNARSPERRKSVPPFECARTLGAVCHTRPVAAVGAVVLGEQTVTACETCELRTSSNRARSPRVRLPVPDGHFNPSIIWWDSRMILATRDSWGHSKVALWELRPRCGFGVSPFPDPASVSWDIIPIGSFASAHPAATRLEDPRLQIGRCPQTGVPKLHCMFNLPDTYPPTVVRVGMVRVGMNLRGIEHTEVYPSPAGNAYEKNWVPFWDPDANEMRWVYGGKPDHIVMGSQNFKTPNPFPWTGGAWRGGAAPVRHNGVYYHFFHGCLKRFTGSVYSVGCAVFEAAPPYRILRQTPSPLIWPAPPGPGENIVKSFVVWPGGAVRVNGGWLLALGIDDTHVRLHRLLDDEVESALTDVPETAAAGIGLRDTPACRGTAGREFV